MVQRSLGLLYIQLLCFWLIVHLLCATFWVCVEMSYSDRLLLYLLATVHLIFIICFIVHCRESLLKVCNLQNLQWDLETLGMAGKSLVSSIKLSYSSFKEAVEPEQITLMCNIMQLVPSLQFSSFPLYYCTRVFQRGYTLCKDLKIHTQRSIWVLPRPKMF